MVQENGPLENAQIVLLLLSGLVFAFKSFAVDRSVRFILWMGSWLCLSFILRELDMEEFTVSQWMIWLGNGMGRNLILATGWGALGIVAVRSYSKWRGQLGRMVRSRSAILAFFAGILLVSGGLFDRETISGEHARVWEESFEIFGYFLLFLSALLSKSIFQEKATVSEFSGS